MRRAVLYTVRAIGALALMGVGVVVGRALRPASGRGLPSVQQYAQAREHVVNAHLAQARPGFILWTGDSHVELAEFPGLSCDRDQVNAGISGARVANTLAFVRALHFPEKASVVVLTIGTNDLLRKHGFANTRSANVLMNEASQLIVTLKKIGRTVIVNAPPPVPKVAAWAIDPDQIQSYSNRLKELCAEIGCLFRDPFAELRTSHFGIAIDGASKDGLHLNDYRVPYGQLVPQLCSSG